jgi:hypothetical protein
VGKIRSPAVQQQKHRNYVVAREDPTPGFLAGRNPTENQEPGTGNCLSAFPVHGLWKLSCPRAPGSTSHFESSRKTAHNIDKVTRAGNSLIAAYPEKSPPTFSSTAPNIGN